jgi:hypothetical protein
MNRSGDSPRITGMTRILSFFIRVIREIRGFFQFRASQRVPVFPDLLPVLMNGPFPRSETPTNRPSGCAR